MTILIALISGIIFGLGLIISGMANPNKVLNFLDLSGNWDPSLILVMLGAIGIASITFSQLKSRKASLLGLPIQLPNTHQLDKRLIGGSLTFGIGWGLSGICPGPALVLAGTGIVKGYIFLAALLIGMALYELIEHYRKQQKN